MTEPPHSAPAQIATAGPVPQTDVFYGWWIVSASFLVQFLAMGTTFYAFGVLLKPLAESLGASRFAIGSALPMMMLVGAVVGPLLGREIDTATHQDLLNKLAAEL